MPKAAKRAAQSPTRIQKSQNVETSSKEEEDIDTPNADSIQAESVATSVQEPILKIEENDVNLKSQSPGFGSRKGWK